MKYIFKKIGIYMARSVIGLFLIMLPSTFLFTCVFSQPHVVKSMLNDSGLYGGISDSMVASLSSSSIAEQQGVSSEIMEKAARTVVSPAVVQTKVESLIDDTYGWLYGEKETISLKLDLTKETQQIGGVVVDEIVASLAQKPHCSTAQLQAMQASQMQDLKALSSMPCQPPNMHYDVLKQQLLASLQGVGQTSQDSTLPLSEFYNTSFQNNSQSHNAQTFGDTVHTVIPLLFRIVAWSFYISIVGIIFALGMLWLLLKDPVQFYGRVAKLLLASGVLLIVYGGMSFWLVHNAGQMLQGDATSQMSTLQASLRPFAGVSIATLIIFGVVYSVIGVGLVFVRRQLVVARVLQNAQHPPETDVQTAPTVQKSPTIQEVIRYNKDHD